tara:strand:- start:6 stop:557 length:552 start_codon:yes stop_codon:yes gene_type:complete
MLTNRSYVVDDIRIPPNISQENDYKSLSCTAKNTCGDLVKIVFLNHPSMQKKVGVTLMRTLMDEMIGEKIRHMIVIVNIGVSPKTKQEILQHHISGNICVECFVENRLMFDLVSHALVPLHRLLADGEIKELVAKYAEVSKLPILDRLDPVARYYNFRQGDVVEITRNMFRTTGHYKHYRVVS